ncbi:MAG: polyketide cyclase [Bacteroidetes bacterium B1(2017)]|nr:MAG: polyketide cyclase [Bacteroidetes bacterium B1(2017)]
MTDSTASSSQNSVIVVETHVVAAINKVWNFFTEPEHICNWNNASDDWHTPFAQNDLQVGGTFSYTMAAKDGSFKFDFGGTYTEVKKHELIAYTLDDSRKVSVEFLGIDGGVKVTETFEPETQNSHELQQAGWQAILSNFKKYVESHA